MIFLVIIHARKMVKEYVNPDGKEIIVIMHVALKVVNTEHANSQTLANAAPVGRDHFAINANPILAVFMVHAAPPGSAVATRAGVVYSATKISTTAPTIDPARIKEPALIQDKVSTPACVRLDSMAPNAKSK